MRTHQACPHDQAVPGHVSQSLMIGRYLDALLHMLTRIIFLRCSLLFPDTTDTSALCYACSSQRQHRSRLHLHVRLPSSPIKLRLCGRHHYGSALLPLRCSRHLPSLPSRSQPATGPPDSHWPIRGRAEFVHPTSRTQTRVCSMTVCLCLLKAAVTQITFLNNLSMSCHQIRGHVRGTCQFYGSST